MRENFVSLHDKTRTTEDSVKYLQGHGILKTETVCPKCQAKLTKTSVKGNCVFFRCQRCDYDESIRKDTFFGPSLQNTK